MDSFTISCLAVSAVWFAIGYALRSTVCKKLSAQIDDLRAQINDREELMAARAKREAQMIESMFQKAHVDISANHGPPRVLDRSPKAIAELMGRNKQKSNSKAEWEQINRDMTDEEEP